MFSKLFGIKKTAPNTFKVKLTIPISWDPKANFPKEGRYPNAVLTLRPGMTYEEAEAHLAAGGSTLSLTDIFFSPSSGAIRATFDTSRVLRRLFFSVNVLDDVIVEGIRLRSSLDEARTSLANLEVDHETNEMVAKYPLKIDATYFKAIRGDVEIQLTVRNGKVRGLGLQTPGWKDPDSST